MDASCSKIYRLFFAILTNILYTSFYLEVGVVRPLREKYLQQFVNQPYILIREIILLLSLTSIQRVYFLLIENKFAVAVDSLKRWLSSHLGRSNIFFLFLCHRGFLIHLRLLDSEAHYYMWNVWLLLSSMIFRKWVFKFVARAQKSSKTFFFSLEMIRWCFSINSSIFFNVNPITTKRVSHYLWIDSCFSRYYLVL